MITSPRALSPSCLHCIHLVQACDEFFRLLSLCHTVLPSMETGELNTINYVAAHGAQYVICALIRRSFPICTCPSFALAGTLEYNAQSPDEAALVSAARNFGYVFKVS